MAYHRRWEAARLATIRRIAHGSPSWLRERHRPRLDTFTELREAEAGSGKEAREDRFTKVGNEREARACLTSSLIADLSAREKNI